MLNYQFTPSQVEAMLVESATFRKHVVECISRSNMYPLNSPYIPRNEVVRLAYNAVVTQSNLIAGIKALRSAYDNNPAAFNANGIFDNETGNDPGLSRRLGLAHAKNIVKSWKTTW